jgi:branched-chain amino acid transport system permease protein
MTFQLFLQLFINGVSIGLLYALVALGLVLVLGVAKVFNFAHGEFYMLGAYALYTFHVTMHLNFPVSVILSGLSVGIIGAVCSELVFKLIRGSLLKAAATTIGMGIIIRQGILQGFGTAERGVSPILPGTVHLAGAVLSLERLAVIGYSLLIVGLLGWFLTRTKAGIAMRATNLDEEAGKLQGINTNMMYLIAISLGSGLAGAAGAIVAPVLALSPEMGEAMLFLVLMVVILGGMQSAVGAVFGGLILGLALSFGFHFLGGLCELFVFFLIGVVVLIKPHGLFGRPVEV